MAKPQSFRRQIPPVPSQFMAQPGVAVESLTFWDQLVEGAAPKGLDYLRPITGVDRAHATQCLNFWLDRGVWRSRYGTIALGDGLGTLLAVINFITGSGVAYLLRFTTLAVEKWNGTSWAGLYSGFTGTLSDKFTFTAFNDMLLFSNGVDGLFEYNPDDGTVVLVEGAPACKHLTTFDGRVIASYVTTPATLPSMIQWSAKNNSHDWAGLGSGNEELLSTPGGQIDQQRGVWPVTDTIALAVRSKSTWQMTVTGNVDAPFRFDRLYDNLGSDAPYSIDTVPGGIVGLFNDDLYVLSHTQILPIGQLLKDRILAETTIKGNAVGMFDPLTKQYWLSNQVFVYRYSFNDQGWSRHQYPNPIVWMTRTKSSLTGLTIDDLDGYAATIDGLNAVWPTIDSMAGTLEVVGNYFITGSTVGFRYVLNETPAGMTDFDISLETQIDSGLELVTGAVGFGALVRTHVLRAEMLYEDTVARNVTISYSLNKGATWVTYSTVATVVTIGPLPVVGRKTIEFRQALFKLTSTKLGQMSLQGLYLYAQRGPAVNL